MKYIELCKGIKSSALAFGCSQIMGSRGASESKIALEIALGEGVNHLDLARSYGYGEAESFIGSCIKGKRNELVLASKFGIKANWKSSLLKPLKPVIRSLKASDKHVSSSPVSAPVSDKKDHFHDLLPINASVMISSLEKSLKALKTDYLDYFFIHETQQTIEAIDEVLEAAEKLKKSGKIRAFGIAFMRNQFDLHKTYIEQLDIWQFDCYPKTDEYDAWKLKRSNASNILFSTLSGDDQSFSETENLLSLQKDFPNSIIISSMFNPEHLMQNTKLFNK
jgi:aryl-alcohol dehydrogenase-like predicted oxidoreductase